MAKEDRTGYICKEPGDKDSLMNAKNPNDERYFCPVCGSKLVASMFKNRDDRHLLVCPMVDVEEFENAEQLEHYKKSVMFTIAENY